MTTQKEKIILNFKKAKGSISKIIEMTENNKYCINVMQQNLAVIGILKSAHQMLMQNHLDSCFKKAMSSSDKKKKERMTQEILEVTKLLNK